MTENEINVIKHPYKKSPKVFTVTLSLHQLILLLVSVLLLTNVITGYIAYSFSKEKIGKLELLLDLITNKDKTKKQEDIESELNKRVLPKKMSVEKIKRLAFAIYISYEKYPSLQLFTISDTIRLIQVESGFDEYAVSDKGAEGCLQLMPTTASAYGVQNSFDCEENVKGGLKYLAHLANKYRSKELALMGFFTGEENLNWHIRQFRDRKIPFPDYLHEYVSKVLI